MLVMFLFFLPPNLRAPSADRRETLPHDRNRRQFYKLTPKIRRALPLKNWGPKTCKISVDFIQPPTLIANISGTAQDIQKRKANVSRPIHPAFYEKGLVNFSPLIRDLIVSLYTLKCTFWGYYTSALRECCALKFLHALEIDQGYLAHTQTGMGVPNKKLIVKI